MLTQRPTRLSQIKTRLSAFPSPAYLPKDRRLPVSVKIDTLRELLSITLRRLNEYYSAQLGETGVT